MRDTLKPKAKAVGLGSRLPTGTKNSFTIWVRVKQKKKHLSYETLPSFIYSY